MRSLNCIEDVELISGSGCIDFLCRSFAFCKIYLEII